MAAPSILCVDDDPVVLRTTETILQRAGYSVFSASNVADAAHILQAFQVDLVLLDCLPECGQLINDVRRLASRTRIAVMTGDPDGVGGGLQADVVLPKPLAPPELLKRIAELLGPTSYEAA